MDGVALLTVLVLASFAGYEVISKVSSTLHTPLMSGSNAISGIILVGTVVIAGQVESPWVLAVALVAVVLGAVNLVGGFVVTDRMLQMFRRPGAEPAPAGGDAVSHASANGGSPSAGPTGGPTSGGASGAGGSTGSAGQAGSAGSTGGDEGAVA